MSNESIIELNRENFCLKAASFGRGQVAIVIGSHKYYPRTFSGNLKSKLHFVCADTRAFTPTSPCHVASDFTIPKIIQDIEMLRATLRVDKIILIGHSIHAFMATEYARSFPDKVSHLVLIAQSPIVGEKLHKEADGYFEESACHERKRALVKTMKEFSQKGHSSFVERMLAFGPRLWYDYNFDASSLWEEVEINSTGSAIVWGPMFETYDIAKSLKEINCSIFLALGKYDYFNPFHLWEKYRSNVSDLTVCVFDNSGHTPQLEEASKFDEKLVNWLKIDAGC